MDFCFRLKIDGKLVEKNNIPNVSTSSSTLWLRVVRTSSADSNSDFNGDSSVSNSQQETLNFFVSILIGPSHVVPVNPRQLEPEKQISMGHSPHWSLRRGPPGCHLSRTASLKGTLGCTGSHQSHVVCSVQQSSPSRWLGHQGHNPRRKERNIRGLPCFHISQAF